MVLMSIKQEKNNKKSKEKKERKRNAKRRDILNNESLKTSYHKVISFPKSINLGKEE